MSKWLSRGERPRPLSCRQAMPMLQSYLDGALEETVADGVATHLAGCDQCAQRVEAYQAIKESLGRRQPPPADAVERLRKFGESLFGESDEQSHEQRSVKG